METFRNTAFKALFYRGIKYKNTIRPKHLPTTLAVQKCCASSIRKNKNKMLPVNAAIRRMCENMPNQAHVPESHINNLAEC